LICLMILSLFTFSMVATAKSFLLLFFLFFFQAEDGIRDRNVTGVQTCALPILWIVLGLRRSTMESTVSPFRTFTLNGEKSLVVGVASFSMFSEGMYVLEDKSL